MQLETVQTSDHLNREKNGPATHAYMEHGVLDSPKSLNLKAAQEKDHTCCSNERVNLLTSSS